MSAYDLRRTRRLLVLLAAAARAGRSGRGVPIARAVQLTGARSEKELLQDVEACAQLQGDPATGHEAPILHVEDGEVNVEYPRTFGQPPAFSLPEGAAVLAALAPFEQDGGRAVKEATRKLRKAIPEVLRPEAERLARGLDLAPVPPGPWAGALREAIARRLETFLEYRAVADQACVRRTVEPRLLFHREGQWYLAAWNVEKDAEHLFRLDRLVTVELGTRVFERHRGPDPSRYARGVYFDSGAERDVTVRFGGASARLARARYGPRARENADGSVSVVLHLTPGNYLYGVLLGHGGEATVEAPADVVAAFQERVAELARRYA